MNAFDLITDDHVIYNMCQQWDTPSLLNMSETHKRIKLVCGDIIDKRKKEYPQVSIENLIKHIHNTEYAVYRKYFSGINIISLVKVFYNLKPLLSEKGFVFINQMVFGDPIPERSIVPWISPLIYVEFKRLASKLKDMQATIYTEEDLSILAKDLYNQKYRELPRNNSGNYIEDLTY